MEVQSCKKRSGKYAYFITRVLYSIHRAVSQGVALKLLKMKDLYYLAAEEANLSDFPCFTLNKHTSCTFFIVYLF